jgi:outer membrane protein, heavy metal efflux system
MRSPKCFSSEAGFFLIALAAGCATVDPRPDFDRAREEIRATTGEQAVYDPEGPPLSAGELEAQLADGLGLEEATRLALLNNRRLQAGFMSLGVARSDFVQAGLLRNPSLSLAFLFPDTGGRARWAADLAGSASELWEIPRRQEVARADLERRILELSRFAGELVYGTKLSYFESVAAGEVRAVAAQSAELARGSLNAVRRQVAGGVATKADENLAESLSLAAELASRSARREEVESRRRLAALLSLEQDLLDVALVDPLPVRAWPELAREQLVEQALGARLDLRAAARGVSAAEEQVALERTRMLPDLTVGVSAERPEGGSSADFLFGPGATVELPVFDRNQAQVSRAGFRLAELQKEHAALAAEIGQEVRAAVDRASIASSNAAFVRDDLVPQAERSAALAGRAYDLGDTILVTLLQAQGALLEARRAATASALEAALSVIEVERVLGVPLASLSGEGP